MISMFLRFYDQTDENIDKCIEELKQINMKFIKVTKRPLTKSCNFMLPEGKHTEVLLYFKTKNELDEFYASVQAKAIYEKYASGKALKKYQSGAIRRAPHDLAFGV